MAHLSYNFDSASSKNTSKIAWKWWGRRPVVGEKGRDMPKVQGATHPELRVITTISTVTN